MVKSIIDVYLARCKERSGELDIPYILATIVVIIAVSSLPLWRRRERRHRVQHIFMKASNFDLLDLSNQDTVLWYMIEDMSMNSRRSALLSSYRFCSYIIEKL